MRHSGVSQHYVGQPMFGLLARAQEAERNGRDMVHFELGDPDYNTPQNIVDATVTALNAGKHHYLPSRGLHELLEAARTVTLGSRGFLPDIDQLLVTPGANAQIYLALACVCDPGSPVVIPCPYFPSYVAQIAAVGAEPIEIDTTEQCGWVMRPDDVVDSLRPDTRAIIVNSPSNPTGAVYTRPELEQLYNIANEHSILLISDEVYSRTIFTQGPFFSPSMIDNCRYTTLVVNGFSKSFAMTGWRLGVATGPKHLIERMRLLLETIQSCVSTPLQWAGVEALTGDQEKVRMMAVGYMKRRNIMCDLLEEKTALRFHRPEGGLYVFARVPDGMTDADYVEFAFERGVVVSPGTIFGKPGYVRLCYACSEDSIRQGVERLAR